MAKPATAATAAAKRTRRIFFADRRSQTPSAKLERIGSRNTSLQPYLHFLQTYLPILVTFRSCNTSMY